VAYFTAVFYEFLVYTEKSHEKRQSGGWPPGPRMETGTSRIKTRSADKFSNAS